MKRSRLFTISLIMMLLVCIVLTGTAGETYAADSPAMVFGQTGINRLAKGTKIRYGSVPSGYTGTPVWRIGTARTSSNGSSGAMFVISEYTWRGPGGSIIFNPDPSAATANTYQGSMAQKWCLDFYDRAFSPAEKAYIVAYNKTDSAARVFSQDWGTSSVTTNDKVFFLSADELWRYVDQNYPLASDINGNLTGYWLRSPYAGSRPTMAGTVGGKVGGVYKDGVNMASGVENGETQPYAARPGFNIKTDQLIMVSALGAKSDSLGNMNKPAAGSEYKLTFIDNSMQLSVGNATNDGTTVTIPFSGATKAKDVYISAAIVHTGNVLYYGEMAVNAESGDIAIPRDLIGAGDELYVFAEKCGDDAEFDYTSSPIRVSIPDPPSPPQSAPTPAPAQAAPSPAPAPIAAVPPARTILLARTIASGNYAAQVGWNNVRADRYLIYYSEYGKKIRLAKAVNGRTLKYTRKGLKRNRRYRFYVVAQRRNGKGYVNIATSKITHMVTSNLWGRYTNAKGIGNVRSNIAIYKGRSIRLRPTVSKVRGGRKILPIKGIAAVRYTTNNPAIATVNGSGVITGKSPGTCYVYVQAINGAWKSVKVTVR